MTDLDSENAAKPLPGCTAFCSLFPEYGFCGYEDVDTTKAFEYLSGTDLLKAEIALSQIPAKEIMSMFGASRNCSEFAERWPAA